MFTQSTRLKQSALAIAITLAVTQAHGAGNVTYGPNAGESVTTGNYNTSVGERAGQEMTTINYNSFFGYGAGRWQSGQDDITAIGYGAGAGSNFIETDPAAGETPPAPDAYDSTYVGTRAGMIDDGGDNVMVGTDAGVQNTTGNDNTFVGERAGSGNTSGKDNTFIGNNSGGVIGDSGPITGSENTGVGSNTLFHLTTGYGNTAVGSEAGADATTGMNNTSVGAFSGYDNGEGMCNTSVGAQSGTHTEYADFNTFIGSHAGMDNNRTNSADKSNANTYLGFATGMSNRDGSNNVLLGAYTDFGNIDETSATNACQTSTISGNGIPTTTNINMDVSNAVAVGASIEITANDAIAIGYQAKATTANAITIGSGSSVTHANAISIGQGVASRADNTAIIGNASTQSLEPGADAATSLGSNTHRYANLHTTQASITATTGNDAVLNLAADNATDNNDQWQVTAADGGDLAIASKSSGSYSNVVALTNTGNMAVTGDVVLSSDERLKRDIQPIDNAMETLRQIEGKTYYWKNEHKDQGKQYGVIAQEVEQVLPEVVTTDEQGMKGVNYQALIPVMLNALRELDSRISHLEQELAATK